MCYTVSVDKKEVKLKIKNKGAISKKTLYLPKPLFSVSAFTYPELPIISSNSPEEISLFHWGLIPSNTNSLLDAKEIREYTLNAKSETIFEKKSYKNCIREKRCLILVTGFFEWMERNGKKYPHYIRLKEEGFFTLGGIWDEWNNSQTKEPVKSFSIVTTEANPLMAKIHNVKKRMPLILDESMREDWLRKDLSENEIRDLMIPFAEENMIAHTISKKITSRSEDNNSPEVILPFDYPELNNEQQSLF